MTGRRKPKLQARARAAFGALSAKTKAPAQVRADFTSGKQSGAR